MNYGVSYMSQYLSASDPTGALPVNSAVGSSSSPQFSGSVDGGTVKWWSTKTAADTWTIYAKGISPTSAVTRNLSVQMRATTTTVPGGTTTANLPQSPVYGWGYVLADPSSDCTVSGGNTLGNSAQITVPTFVAGSLCLSGGGSPLIAEPAAEPAGVTQSVTLYIGKKYQTASNSSPVGTSAKPILSEDIVNGCQVSFHGWQNVSCSTPGVPTNGTGSGIWASSYSTAQQTVTKPTIDTAWYANAQPGPANACNGASTVGLLKLESAGNTSRDTSVGTENLLHLNSTNQADTVNNFDCRFYDGTGTLVGRLKWVDGSPGTLTVLGTIFIDGNLNLSNNDNAVYQGIGTIYVDGTVTIGNGARLCAAPESGGDCTGTWDTTQNVLEIVAVNHNNAVNAFSVAGDGQFQGIAFMNGNFVSGNSAWVGTVIADTGQLGGDAKFTNLPPAPPGAPGAASTTTTTLPSTTTTTWNLPAGSWSQY